MKKSLIYFWPMAIVSAILFCGLNALPAQAQVFGYDAECDVSNSGGIQGVADSVINEFDLKLIYGLITAKTDCSTTTPACASCDANKDNKCNSNDSKLCKSILGATSSFSHTGISDYPKEPAVLGMNISHNAIKAKIAENAATIGGYANVNIIDSTWLEGYYHDFKYAYAKRKYMNPPLTWADLNGDSALDSADKKIFDKFRKKITNAYGEKITSETEAYAKIMEGRMDLNSDGAINELDKEIADNFYKNLKLYLKGKITSLNMSVYNFDTASSALNEADLNAIKGYNKQMSKYYHLFNYDPADIKAKILAEDFDLNNDFVVNATDYDAIKDYQKRMKKMMKETAGGNNAYAYYDLNGSGTVEDSDIVLAGKYLAKLRQHMKYGRIKYQTPDTVSPLIWLKGDSTVSLTQGAAYKEKGYEAWDNRGRNMAREVEVNNGGLNTNTPGTYTITYTVSDGVNTTSVTRTVVVGESSAEPIMPAGKSSDAAWNNKCDYVEDGEINEADWNIFKFDWGRTNCLDSVDACECDLNTDGKCDMRDYVLFGKCWQTAAASGNLNMPGDMNPVSIWNNDCDYVEDGKINEADWSMFKLDWGRTDCANSVDFCECDLSKDGKCDMQDYLLFGKCWKTVIIYNNLVKPAAKIPDAVWNSKCDYTGDGQVNDADWSMFKLDWGRTDCDTSVSVCKYDLNKDGKCDMQDWLLYGEIKTADWNAFKLDWGRTDCDTSVSVCKYDLNKDGKCDMQDWLLYGEISEADWNAFKVDWGRTDCKSIDVCECDLNSDGRCDMQDWLLFGRCWNTQLTL